jgi:hypothetical protein
LAAYFITKKCNKHTEDVHSEEHLPGDVHSEEHPLGVNPSTKGTLIEKELSEKFQIWYKDFLEKDYILESEKNFKAASAKDLGVVINLFLDSISLVKRYLKIFLDGLEFNEFEDEFFDGLNGELKVRVKNTKVIVNLYKGCRNPDKCCYNPLENYNNVSPTVAGVLGELTPAFSHFTTALSAPILYFKAEAFDDFNWREAFSFSVPVFGFAFKNGIVLHQLGLELNVASISFKGFFMIIFRSKELIKCLKKLKKNLKIVLNGLEKGLNENPNVDFLLNLLKKFSYNGRDDFNRKLI